MERQAVLYQFIKQLLDVLHSMMSSSQGFANSITSFSIPDTDKNPDWIKIVRDDDRQIAIHIKVLHKTFSETYLRSDDEWIRHRDEGISTIQLYLSKLDIRPPKEPGKGGEDIFGGVVTVYGKKTDTYALNLEQLSGFYHYQDKYLTLSRPVGELLIHYPYILVCI